MWYIVSILCGGENGMGEIKKFETVQDWLESDNPEEYDFVEDAQGKKATLDYGEIEGEYGVYERFLVYKYDKNKIDWSNIEDILQGKANLKDIIIKYDKYDTRDPDSYSGLLQSIYRELWPDLVESDFMKAGKNTGYSDTMTSASTTFRHALEAIINVKDAPKDIDENIINTIRTIYKNCDVKLKKGQEWWSGNFTMLVAAVLGEEFYEIISNYYSGMKGFLESYHTVGNFCPVPRYFNGARSHGKCDYWDLTLMKIREWYEYDREEGEDRKEEKKIV